MTKPLDLNRIRRDSVAAWSDIEPVVLHFIEQDHLLREAKRLEDLLREDVPALVAALDELAGLLEAIEWDQFDRPEVYPRRDIIEAALARVRRLDD